MASPTKPKPVFVTFGNFYLILFCRSSFGVKFCLD